MSLNGSPSPHGSATWAEDDGGPRNSDSSRSYHTASLFASESTVSTEDARGPDSSQPSHTASPSASIAEIRFTSSRASRTGDDRGTQTSDSSLSYNTAPPFASESAISTEDTCGLQSVDSSQLCHMASPYASGIEIRFTAPELVTASQAVDGSSADAADHPLSSERYDGPISPDQLGSYISRGSQSSDPPDFLIPDAQCVSRLQSLYQFAPSAQGPRSSQSNSHSDLDSHITSWKSWSTHAPDHLQSSGTQNSDLHTHGTWRTWSTHTADHPSTQHFGDQRVMYYNISPDHMPSQYADRLAMLKEGHAAAAGMQSDSPIMLGESYIDGTQKLNSAEGYTDGTQNLNSADGGHKNHITHPDAGQSNNPNDYEQKYPVDGILEEMDHNARIWRVYLNEAEAFDNDMIQAFKDTIDVLLVFVCLTQEAPS